MTEDTIKAVEVQETEFGEKVVIESPFDAKEFISALPWQELEQEVSEHGSLRNKLEKRGVDDAAICAAEDFEFTDDFAAHASWDENALGKGHGAWTIDRESWAQAKNFFEFVGFETESNISL